MSPAASVFRRFSQSLSGRTLSQVGLGLVIIVVLSTAVTYGIVYREIEERTLGRLSEYASQRARFHQSHFDLAREYHAVLAEQLVQLHESATFKPAMTFDELMAHDPDGAWRNQSKYSDVSRISNGWVNKRARVDASFKRLLEIYFALSERYARIFSKRFLNLYFIDPDGLSTMGWEDVSRVNNRRWIYETPADYPYDTLEAYRMALPASNHQRGTRWGTPFFEPGYQKMLVTAATPVYSRGRLIGIVGTDDLVEDLTRSILQSDIPGTTHSVFATDGRLIVDARHMNEIASREPGYWIRDARDPRLSALLTATRASASPVLKGYDNSADHYYAIGTLKGPDWYFASTLPGELVRAEAFRSAQWVLWVGFTSLSLLLAILAMVLRRQVDQPLRALMQSTRRIAAGGSAPTGIKGSGEIGSLLRSFDAMATRINERDRALRAEKERFRSLTEHGADFIVVMDAQGINRYASATIETILGHRPEAVVGKSGFDLMHRDDREIIRAAFHRCSRTPGARTGKLRYRTRNSQGQWRWMESNGTNLLQHPAVEGFVVNQHDVTDQVAAEEEVARQRDALTQRERLASMGSLLAGVAHELNNPLAVVVGRAVMLEDESSDPAIRANAQRIRTAAERCARIVRTFLAMARQSGQEKSMASLEAVIDSALEMVEYSVRSNGVQVIRTRDASLPMLYLDPDQLHQVFMNLFVNAYQAMAEQHGKRELRIATLYAADAGTAQVQVSDTGPGIPESIRARIFDPYFTTKAVGSGTGVGLSVSLMVVESHGGTLGVECPAEGGTQFTVTLPASAPGHADERESTLGSSSRAQRPRRVLVVDDEQEIRDMLSDILRDAGATVDLAEDGQAALSLIQQHDYDAVLTDLRMPALDGPELYRRIQTLRPGLAARVIFVTGDSLSGTVPHFVASTGQPMLEKPFLPEQVLRVLDSLRTES